MTEVRTKALGEQNDAAHPGQTAVEAKRRTQKILAVVDGSERTGRVLEYLIGLAEIGVPIDVVVLNIQPEPEDWRLRGYRSFKQDEVRDRLVNDLGKPIVASVGRRLDQIDTAHRERVELGAPAETILRCAREERCDLIVLSEGRPGAFRTWLSTATGLSFASVATKVVQLSEIPVVVLK